MVRYTVGKITPIQRREVRASDFGAKASFWMNFPKEGSQLTPPHQSDDFKWKDYCPMVFRLVGTFLGIFFYLTAASFIDSIDMQLNQTLLNKSLLATLMDRLTASGNMISSIFIRI